MGGAGAIGGFVGGLASGHLSELQIHVIFLSVVLAALALLFLPVRELAVTGDALPDFNLPFAVGLGALVGAIAGMLGAGGGFLIVPLMLTALRIPLRMAIGSSSVVTLISSSFAYAGKLLSNRIDPALAIALLAGTIPCTYAGSWLARVVPSGVLRALLGLMLAGIAAHSVRTLFSTA